MEAAARGDEIDGQIRFDDGAVAMQRVACPDLVPWLPSDRHTMEENESLAVFAKHLKTRMDAVYARHAAAAQGDEAGSRKARRTVMEESYALDNASIEEDEE